MMRKYLKNLSALSGKRDLRIDSIKGFLIILVVYGHLLEPFRNDSLLVKGLYLLIYSFHMPLFVLLSGYFFNANVSYRKIWKSELLILESFLVFQTIRIILSHSDFNISSFVVPAWTLWFLVSLIMWRAFSYMIFRVLPLSQKSLFVLLFLSVLVALWVGYLPIDVEFSFQRTFSYFPFFILGIFLRKRINNIKVSPRFVWISLLALVISGAYLITVCDFSSYYCPFWASVAYSDGYTLFIRLCCLLIGGALSFFLLIYFPTSKLLALIGAETMMIYLFHSFIVEILVKRFFDYIPMLENIVVLGFAAVIVTLVIFMCSKISCFKFILNPFSKSIGKL